MTHGSPVPPSRFPEMGWNSAIDRYSNNLFEPSMLDTDGDSWREDGGNSVRRWPLYVTRGLGLFRGRPPTTPWGVATHPWNDCIQIIPPFLSFRLRFAFGHCSTFQYGPGYPVANTTGFKNAVFVEDNGGSNDDISAEGVRSSGDFRVLVVFVDGILWGVDNVSLLANFGSL